MYTLGVAKKFKKYKGESEMKNFGKGSISSVISVLLAVAWWFVLVGSIIGSIAYSVIIFSPDAGKFITEQIAKDVEVQKAKLPKGGSEWEKFQREVEAKELRDMEDWETFRKAPLALKALAYPYLIAIVTLLLIIMHKSKKLFDNFKNEIVFNKANVSIISEANKAACDFLDYHI